jgi:hypothetical protein
MSFDFAEWRERIERAKAAGDLATSIDFAQWTKLSDELQRAKMRWEIGPSPAAPLLSTSKNPFFGRSVKISKVGARKRSLPLVSNGGSSTRPFGLGR